MDHQKLIERKYLLSAFFILLLLPVLLSPIVASGDGTGISPAEAQKKLKDCNSRYFQGNAQHPNLLSDRRYQTTTGGQHPFATVITCSDSRVMPEVAFDQGIGDVFVIRVAGNVVDVDEIGSIEYGVDHLETQLFLVLGHRNWGSSHCRRYRCRTAWQYPAVG